VVTRWFGGIKLGAGGLVRAYGGAAAECLRLAAREPLVQMVELELECPFEALGAVHAALAAHSAEKTSEAFVADGARLGLRLPASQAEPLRTRLRDATRDRVRVAIPGSPPRATTNQTPAAACSGSEACARCGRSSAATVACSSPGSARWRCPPAPP